MLRERHDGANIVLSPRAPNLTISDLKLRATSLEQELEALCVTSGNQIMWSFGNPGPAGLDPRPGCRPAPVPPADFRLRSRRPLPLRLRLLRTKRRCTSSANCHPTLRRPAARGSIQSHGVF